jgi:cysteine synthase A
VGGNPLVEFSRLCHGLNARIVGKLEMRNPAGSLKDRLGIALTEDAERRGVLNPGMTIVEATGGNTGIGLAFAAAIRDYRLIVAMPGSMSNERVALLRQYGAEIVLTPGILMAQAVARAKDITARTPGAINLDQFSNPANPALHKRTTGVEIWNDTGGGLDVFVSAVGTGGTITGVGELLQERKPGVKIVAVEPAGSAVLSGKPAGSHRMPGIGVGFVPPVLNRDLLDEVIAVSDADAFACTRRLTRDEGVLAGVSSGAALHASLILAARPVYEGKLIVVIICDTGERYLSSSLFADSQPPD